jgi:hypothetical protein
MKKRVAILLAAATSATLPQTYWRVLRFRQRKTAGHNIRACLECEPSHIIAAATRSRLCSTFLSSRSRMRTAMFVLAGALSRAIGTNVDTLVLIFSGIGLVISIIAALIFGLDLRGTLF